MSTYSVAEARNGLPRLIDKAKAGERVTITRRGKAVAELVPINAAPEKDPRAMHEWLKSRAKSRPRLEGVTSLDILQAMKDETLW